MDGDDQPRRFRGASLAFAYVCFGVATLTIGAAIAILPLDIKVRAFLAAAGLLLVVMFGFMAFAAHVVTRAASRGAPSRDPEASPEREDAGRRADAGCSHRLG